MGRAGAYGHEQADTQQYCHDFDIDYLKIDLCGGEQYPHLNQSWIKFRKAFDECATQRGGKPIVMSVEYCGPDHPEQQEARRLYREQLNAEYLDYLDSNRSQAAVSIGTGLGQAEPEPCGAWVPHLANLWRTSSDLQPTWDSMYASASANDVMASVAGPGHWVSGALAADTVPRPLTRVRSRPFPCAGKSTARTTPIVSAAHAFVPDQ